MRDITEFGLDNAISMQGGVEYLRNMNISSSQDFSINVVSDLEFGMFRRTETEAELIGIETYEVIYDFAMRFTKSGFGFEIVKDKFTQKCNFVRLEKQKDKLETKEKLGEGVIIFSCDNGKIKIDLNKPDGVEIKEDDILPSFLREEKVKPKTSLLEYPFLMPPLDKMFGNISIYDFDPKLPKKATPVTGKAELEEDGNNLSIALKNIVKDKKKKDKLTNLITEILPFIKDLGVERFADKSWLFYIREKYFKKQNLPASLISDGTINITALIMALYFGNKSLTIIEEPERNIHPYLISKVIDMMKDASRKKQIIITTHNPEIVKYADLESILLVSRDKEGFSNISRPADKDTVKTFLENEMGIEELYVQNLLEV